MFRRFAKPSDLTRALSASCSNKRTHKPVTVKFHCEGALQTLKENPLEKCFSYSCFSLDRLCSWCQCAASRRSHRLKQWKSVKVNSFLDILTRAPWTSTWQLAVQLLTPRAELTRASDFRSSTNASRRWDSGPRSDPGRCFFGRVRWREMAWFLHLREGQQEITEHQKRKRLWMTRAVRS